MKSHIRRILKEETEATLLDIVKDVGRAGVDSLKRFISAFVGHRPTKARLIFPKKGWETTAVEIAERLGIVTGTYKNLGQANKFLKELKNDGIILEELLVGSHGSPGTLLSTRIYKNNYSFKDDFLKHVKAVISPETKVYFTACKGADKLGTLKDAADYLGCECFACMGDNAFSFGCAESNWSCNPRPDIPTFKNIPSGWDEISVVTGVELDKEKVLGPSSEWKYDKKSTMERLNKIKEVNKMWDTWVAEQYEELGVCQEQPNLPFNWISINAGSIHTLSNDATKDNIYN